MKPLFLLIPALLLLLAGCGPSPEDRGGDDPPPPDTDGDGLTDVFETETSLTDPDNVDSDGDGFGDGEEYLTFHFPNDAEDFPRAGSYPRHAREADLGVPGSSEGQLMPNFWAEDQNGESISLHELYGNVILLKLSADW